MTNRPTAAMIIIGNEILSGRTQDKNLNYLATELTKHGVDLNEVRVVRDVEEAIISTVNELRKTHDYVFTTGGIGPTHDDITAPCIAKAFGVDLVADDAALQCLQDYYDGRNDDFTEARRRMANVPEGATLIENPVSAAPGFNIGNVYVMAGVPRIFQGMLDGVKHTLAGGDPLQSITVTAQIKESDIAAKLGEIQDANPDVEIGSYPYFRDGVLGTALVARASDDDALTNVADAIRTAVTELGGSISDD